MMDEEAVAAAIHEGWRALSRAEGWSMQPRIDRPYAELGEPDKEVNRAAARRIPAVLAKAGLALRRAGEGAEPALADVDLRRLLEQGMERLAEAEHNGWMAHMAGDGWRHGAVRDDAAKRHPSMIPYAQLSEAEKEKDRNNVRYYPDFAASAGHRVVRVG
jgi:hypothetical protein